MSRFPANPQEASGSITTVAFVETTVLVVAAPGVGWRLRIWLVGINPDSPTMTLPQQFRGRWRDAVSGRELPRHYTGGNSIGVMQTGIPSGRPLAANAALQLIHNASVGGQFYFYWCLYTAERVA